MNYGITELRNYGIRIYVSGIRMGPHIQTGRNGCSGPLSGYEATSRGQLEGSLEGYVEAELELQSFVGSCLSCWIPDVDPDSVIP